MIQVMGFSLNLNTMFILVFKSGADWQFWTSTIMVYSAFYRHRMVLYGGNSSCG